MFSKVVTAKCSLKARIMDKIHHDDKGTARPSSSLLAYIIVVCFYSKWDRQRTHKRNTEARSRNHRCRGKSEYYIF